MSRKKQSYASEDVPEKKPLCANNRSPVATTILITCCVLRCFGYLAVLLVTILFHTNTITMVGDWVEKVLEHADSTVKQTISGSVFYAITVIYMLVGFFLFLNLLIIVGALVRSASMLSVCVVIDQAIATFAVFVFGLVAFLVMSGAGSASEQLMDMMTNALVNARPNQTVEILNDIQTGLHCCGFKDADDWWRTEMHSWNNMLNGEKQSLHNDPSWLGRCSERRGYLCYVPDSCCNLPKKDKCNAANTTAEHFLHATFHGRNASVFNIVDIEKTRKAHPKHADLLWDVGCWERLRSRVAKWGMGVLLVCTLVGVLSMAIVELVAHIVGKLDHYACLSYR